MNSKNTFVTLLTGLLLLAASTAHAQIIEVGDLNIINDAGNPSDGLRYLDMTYSDGLTSSDALTNAQSTYPNARLATPSEFDDLFSAAGIAYLGSETASDGFAVGAHDTAISLNLSYDGGALVQALGATIQSSSNDWTLIWTVPDGSADPLTTRDLLALKHTSATINNQVDVPASAAVGWLIVSEPLNVNEPPTADAGDDQSIRAGDTVSLDGSASFDDNSTLLDYDWSFDSKPATSNATLDDATAVMPSFVADVEGTYVLQLIVTDEEGLTSAPGFVEISSDNLAPTAVATVDFSLAIVGAPVQFDGSGSTDPEMDPLTYSWSITSAPVGSTAILVGDNTATPTLTTDVEGTYDVTLAVSDFLGPGTPAILSVVATTAEEFAEILILDGNDQVSDLTTGQVTTKGNQNAFGNFLAQAISEIQAGDIAAAIEKLNKAIARTDGCVLRGSVDGNGPGRDWITDCDAQIAIYDLLTQAIETLEN